MIFACAPREVLRQVCRAAARLRGAVARPQQRVGPLAAQAADFLLAGLWRDRHVLVPCAHPQGLPPRRRPLRPGSQGGLLSPLIYNLCCQPLASYLLHLQCTGAIRAIRLPSGATQPPSRGCHNGAHARGRRPARRLRWRAAVLHGHQGQADRRQVPRPHVGCASSPPPLFCRGPRCHGAEILSAG